LNIIKKNQPIKDSLFYTKVKANIQNTMSFIGGINTICLQRETDSLYGIPIREQRFDSLVNVSIYNLRIVPESDSLKNLILYQALLIYNTLLSTNYFYNKEIYIKFLKECQKSGLFDYSNWEVYINNYTTSYTCHPYLKHDSLPLYIFSERVRHENKYFDNKFLDILAKQRYSILYR
jgi:hypothetical protein